MGFNDRSTTSSRRIWMKTHCSAIDLDEIAKDLLAANRRDPLPPEVALLIFES
jgi:hypothetical protein